MEITSRDPDSLATHNSQEVAVSSESDQRDANLIEQIQGDLENGNFDDAVTRCSSALENPNLFTSEKWVLMRYLGAAQCHRALYLFHDSSFSETSRSESSNFIEDLRVGLDNLWGARAGLESVATTLESVATGLESLATERESGPFFKDAMEGYKRVWLAEKEVTEVGMDIETILFRLLKALEQK